jgi:hypothetical protein
MREEARRVLEHPSFQSAPVLSKLLRYLVEETVAGRGNSLKGYSVAVEGLGRPEDFDSHADSYPRVQVGRLRRALESYYSQHAPRADLCIYIQPGSYRVRLGSLAAAYPNLFRPLGDGVQSRPPNFAPGQAMAIPARPADKPWTRWPIAVAALAGLGVVAGCIYAAGWTGGEAARNPSGPAGVRSPTVHVKPLATAAGATSDPLAQDAYAMLVDGISRSWVARVRVENAASANAANAGAADSYIIEAQLSSGVGAPGQIFVRLADAKTGTLIWSTTKAVASPGGRIDAELASLISQISGPYGIIANEEARRHRDSFSPGYACMLQYLSFLASRDPISQPKVARCLRRPSPETGLEATRYAFLSSYMLEAENVGRDQKKAIVQAQAYAERAVRIDPNQGYAHFARARAAFVAADCTEGGRSARLAVAASPYDPIILGVLGGLVTNCGLAEGTAMLERAYSFRGPGESYARLSLILSAIRDNRLDRLRALSEAELPPTGSRASYYYLSETLIDAAQGDQKSARKNWARFQSSARPADPSPDAALATVILVPSLRARIALYLAVKGVIDPPRLSTEGPLASNGR